MSKLDQLKALRERGQGGVRTEPKAKTVARLRAAAAIPPKPRKKPKRN